MDESEQNIHELRAEYAQKKKEMSSLRQQLRDLFLQKEATFGELCKVRETIKARAAQISKIKCERDSITGEVKKLKEQRDQLNSQVQEKSSVKKEADEKKKQLQEKMQGTESPGRLKHQIEALERKIETEVMPFTKEQQLTKMIKRMKARYKELRALGDVWKEADSVSADFSHVRREAQDAHRSIQDKAQQSQQRHEQLTVLVEEIQKLREQQKPLDEKGRAQKAKIEEMKKQLDELSARVDELGKLFQENDTRSYTQKAKERTAEVQEKLKKGKKLSTEDILAFQALKE